MASRGLFQNISGKSGEIRIKSIGVLVGTMSDWKLTRRGDDVPGAGLYDLYAAFSYVNPALWADADYEKTITVKIGKQVFGVEQEPGFEMNLDDRKTLRMQGVKLCQ